jgi:hypothetical protein
MEEVQLDTKYQCVIPKYPSIVLLDKRQDLFAVKEVVATEKLHGSTFRIYFPLGMASLDDVQFGSHDMDLREHSKDNKFPLMNAVKLFRETKRDLLGAMWEVIKSYGFSDTCVFGEAYGPGVHAKGVRYSEGQEILFRSFDMMVANNFITYDLFTEIADKMGLPRVHEVWRGAPTQEAFDALLEKPSVEGLKNGITNPANVAEGVVIRSNPLFRDVFGTWLIAKHKAKKFAEKAHAPSEKKDPTVTPAQVFAETYVTEGRIRNVSGHMRDRSELAGTMADMPKLITAIIADLHKEHEPEWLATGDNDKSLVSAVSRVAGPIYRLLLAE